MLPLSVTDDDGDVAIDVIHNGWPLKEVTSGAGGITAPGKVARTANRQRDCDAVCQ